MANPFSLPLSTHIHTPFLSHTLCLSRTHIILSLSLSHTHTHTHLTHSFTLPSPSHSHTHSHSSLSLCPHAHTSLSHTHTITHTRTQHRICTDGQQKAHRLFFAGEATAYDSNPQTVHGAFESGVRAAIQCHAALQQQQQQEEKGATAHFQSFAKL